MTLTNQQILINTAFNELHTELSLVQYRDSFTTKEGKSHLIQHSTDRFPSGFAPPPMTTTTNLFDGQQFELEFQLKLELASKILKVVPKNKVLTFFSEHQNLFPQDLSMHILESNHNRYYNTISPNRITYFQNYELPLLSKNPFKTLRANDFNMFFNLINNIIEIDKNKLISRQQITKTIDDFIETNLDKINSHNKINYIMLKLNSEYHELSKKYSALFNLDQSESLFKEDKVKLDSIILNKTTFMKKFPINAPYGIAGNTEYRKVLEYVFTKIKNSNHKQIFQVDNILIIQFSDKTNTIEICIKEGKNYTPTNNEIIKSYITEAMLLFSNESAKNSKLDFFKIREIVEVNLDKLVLSVLLNFNLPLENNKNIPKSNKI